MNDKFYEQTLKNRFYDSRDRADIYVRAKRDNAIKYGKQKDSHYGITPMELNSVKRGKGKPLRKKQRKQSCYKCDKSKHFARNCKSKNVMFNRQLNVMLKIKSEQKNEGEFLKFNSKNEFIYVKNSEYFQKRLIDETLKKTFRSIKKVNKIIKSAKKQSATFYSEKN